jgi:hypothetical protein
MHIFPGDFNFKRLTARRLYKSFGVKGLTWSDIYHPIQRLRPWRTETVLP